MQEITKLQPFVKLFADEYNEHQKTKLRVFSLDDIEFNFSTLKSVIHYKIPSLRI